VSGVAFMLYLVMSLAISAINANPYALVGSQWLPIISIGASIVQAVLLAPLAIAVHRFVLLGGKTDRYPLERTLPAFRRLRDASQNSLADPEHDRELDSSRPG
jgi:hypothetical protein